jgi:hypothetical protein
MSVPAAALRSAMPDTLELEHLLDIHVDLEPVQLVPSPGGTRMIFVAQGGTVSGERLSGEILPGGGDWLLVGSDRVGRIDVRTTIRTTDGALIAMTNTGVVALGDEALARFAAGEDVRCDEAYIRSAPLFETGAPAYSWLNSTVTVAINALGPGYVDYRVFRVL